MSRKLSSFLLILLAALAFNACVVAPAPTPTPTPGPTPVPVPTPDPVTPPPVIENGGDEEPPQEVTNAISREVFTQVTVGMHIDEIKALVGNVPLAINPPVRQPDGGALYRYRLLDSDGKWRSRHANFVVGPDGRLKRKSIS